MFEAVNGAAWSVPLHQHEGHLGPWPAYHRRTGMSLGCDQGCSDVNRNGCLGIVLQPVSHP